MPKDRTTMLPTGSASSAGDSTTVQTKGGATRFLAPSGAGRSGILDLSEVRWATVSLALFLSGLLLQAAGAPDLLSDTVYLTCYVAGGWEPARAGLEALRERTLDVDLLMVVAAVAAACLGQFLDGGLLIVIFATSGAQEALATKRTADSVTSLLSLAPERATLDVGGREQVVDTATLVPGDVIVVRPGERIGADGTVASGSSEVDQRPSPGSRLRSIGRSATRSSPAPTTGRERSTSSCRGLRQTAW